MMLLLVKVLLWGDCLQVSSLRALIEDWEFQEAPFLEFVAPALQLLAALLQESTELDTQLQVCWKVS